VEGRIADVVCGDFYVRTCNNVSSEPVLTEFLLQQIDSNEYLLPYTLNERELVKVGVSFDKEKRNIGRYLIG
jgi:hypothetical protein